MSMARRTPIFYRRLPAGSSSPPGLPRIPAETTPPRCAPSIVVAPRLARYPDFVPVGRAHRATMTTPPRIPRALLLCSLAALLISVAPGGADTPVRAPFPNPGAHSPAQQSPSSYSADLPGSTRWQDTGLDLQPGDRVEIAATGQLQYAEAKTPTGPDGYPRGWKDL